ncbi:hypothetical protein ACOACQ_11500 [Nocardioides sp. CPCC 206347]|uniref:hypothetical protein n=1 Tax=unclassified Nocardioides TaxID=2615069 RepID=UPI00361790C7
MLMRVVAGVLALGLLAGCGSDDDSKADDKSSEKPSPSATTEAPARYYDVPVGVTLTEPGTQLALGAPAVIAFERRQKEIGVLAVKVDRIERTSFQESFAGWNVDDVTAARTPYFVRLTVTNVGDTDLGGLKLDNVIWADDGTTLEAPNHYTKVQQPLCAGDPLPAAFANGARAQICQVYFIAPAQTLRTISFIPPAGLDPITWAGEISKVTPPAKKKAKKKPGQAAT